MAANTAPLRPGLLRGRPMGRALGARPPPNQAARPRRPGAPAALFGGSDALSGVGLSDEALLLWKASYWQSSPRGSFYVVPPGECAWHVAQLHRLDMATLAALNPGVDLSRISPGDVLAVHAPAASAPRPQPSAREHAPPTARATPPAWLEEQVRSELVSSVAIPVMFPTAAPPPHGLLGLTSAAPLAALSLALVAGAAVTLQSLQPRPSTARVHAAWRLGLPPTVTGPPPPDPGATGPRTLAARLLSGTLARLRGPLGGAFFFPPPPPAPVSPPDTPGAAPPSKFGAAVVVESLTRELGGTRRALESSRDESVALRAATAASHAASIERRRAELTGGGHAHAPVDVTTAHADATAAQEARVAAAMAAATRAEAAATETRAQWAQAGREAQAAAADAARESATLRSRLAAAQAESAAAVTAARDAESARRDTESARREAETAFGATARRVAALEDQLAAMAAETMRASLAGAAAGTGDALNALEIALAATGDDDDDEYDAGVGGVGGGDPPWMAALVAAGDRVSAIERQLWGDSRGGGDSRGDGDDDAGLQARLSSSSSSSRGLVSGLARAAAAATTAGLTPTLTPSDLPATVADLTAAVAAGADRAAALQSALSAAHEALAAQQVAAATAADRARAAAASLAASAADLARQGAAGDVSLSHGAVATGAQSLADLESEFSTLAVWGDALGVEVTATAAAADAQVAGLRAAAAEACDRASTAEALLVAIAAEADASPSPESIDDGGDVMLSSPQADALRQLAAEVESASAWAADLQATAAWFELNGGLGAAEITAAAAVSESVAAVAGARRAEVVAAAACVDAADSAHGVGPALEAIGAALTAASTWAADITAFTRGDDDAAANAARALGDARSRLGELEDALGLSDGREMTHHAGQDARGMAAVVAAVGAAAAAGATTVAALSASIDSALAGGVTTSLANVAAKARGVQSDLAAAAASMGDDGRHGESLIQQSRNQQSLLSDCAAVGRSLAVFDSALTAVGAADAAPALRAHAASLVVELREIAARAEAMGHMNSREGGEDESALDAALKSLEAAAAAVEATTGSLGSLDDGPRLAAAHARALEGAEAAAVAAEALAARMMRRAGGEAAPA